MRSALLLPLLALSCTGGPACEDLFVDLDGDGYGEFAPNACGPDVPLVEEGGDCDDEDPLVFPGQVELCNGRLDDCEDTSFDILCDRAILAQCGDTIGIYTAGGGGFTAAGTEVWSAKLPIPDADPRGAARIDASRFVVVSGTSTPELLIHDVSDGTWTRHTIDGWQIRDEPLIGGVAAYRGKVYVASSAGDATGLYSFDPDTGEGAIFQPMSGDSTPLYVTLGEGNMAWVVRADSVLESFSLSDTGAPITVLTPRWGFKTVAVSAGGDWVATDAQSVYYFRAGIQRLYTGLDDIVSADRHDDFGWVASGPTSTIASLDQGFSEDTFDLPASGPCWVAWAD